VHGARAERDEPRAAGLGIRAIASSAYAQHTLMRSAITSEKPMQSEALPEWELNIGQAFFGVPLMDGTHERKIAVSPPWPCPSTVLTKR